MLQIFCLMVCGRGLDDAARNYLFRAAAEMIKKNDTRRLIRTDEFNGIIRTDFESVPLGSVFGIVFYAEIESSVGRTNVNYIIRAKDLDMALDEDYG